MAQLVYLCFRLCCCTQLSPTSPSFASPLQALIAETVGQAEEAMDLFRHCTQLSPGHPEASRGYAHFVCSLLGDVTRKRSDWSRYVIERMFAVPAASDEMAKYTGEMLIHVQLHCTWLIAVAQ